MSSAPTCRTCGAPLTVSAAGPFCPACILGLAAAEETDVVESEAGGSFPRPFGDYELLAEVGRGGTGLVFRARQRSLNRIVALKVLLTGRFSDDAARRRFRLEAESAAGVQHPGIVVIHEIGEAEGHPFLTMDFVNGPNLAELCDGRPLPARTAARHLRDIARAVQAAHAAGVLHRDLKPSNILVDADQRPRVTDFGLAKHRDATDGPTLAGQVLGSPNYTSPEQAAGRNEAVGAASDVYGLGALLYHLVTGHAPFNAATPAETLRLVLDTDPPSPRLLNPALPRDLETICLKCLQKNPARRYASAADVADELERFLSDRAILARPASGLELAWRWGRRHPAIAALAATVVAALTVSSAVFYTSARRIDRARARELAARLTAEEELYASSMLAISMGTVTPAGMDPRDLRERLDAARPRPGAPDQRGFEWRYFWAGSRGDTLATLAGHHHVVDAAFFSPDGATLATHSLEGVLKVWDASTMKELVTLDHVAWAGGFAAGGAQLIFSRPDDSIWRFDLATRTAGKVLDPGPRLIAAQPDGRHVVVFGPDQLPVLRALDGTIAASAPGGEVPLDTCAVVSADGTRAAVAGRSYPGILVIDLATHRQLAALIDPRPVIGLALSPDGSRLVSAGFDGVLKVWDVGRGTLERSFKAFVDPIWGLAFSADGRSFAAGGNNRDVRIWDASTWTEKGDLRGHHSTVRCVAFAPDGNRLVSGAEDELALVWPAQTDRPPEEMPQLLRGPQWIDRTPSIDFSPDSRLFAGTAADGTIKVWRTDSIQPAATFPMEARTVAFSPDGKSLLGEDYGGGVQRWDLGSGQLAETTRPKTAFANWQVDPLSPPERVGLVADQADTRARCRLCEIPSARDGINAGAMTTTPTLAMSADGRTMFVGLPQGSVEIWDMASRQRRSTFAAHKLPVTALAVSADGHFLATGSLDNSTKLWDVATGRLLTTYHEHNRPVWALAFSPDGKTLAAGSCDKGIILCSTTLLRHVASLPLFVGTPKDYTQEVRLLRFSPDGNILAAALGDGTLRFFRAVSFAAADADVAAAP
jgi:WD40 repeat protein/predicted Ser/Thr protein kinase